jgi:hypothetical protein
MMSTHENGARLWRASQISNAKGKDGVKYEAPLPN